MRTLHYIVCLPVAFAPFLLAANPGDKATPAPAAAAPLIPPQVLSPIENIVHQLAKGAREREVKDLLVALEKLGYPAANHDKLEKTSKDELAKAKSPLDSLPAGAKQLRITAGQLAAIMDKMTDEEAKKDLARNILRLDGECAPAHAVLGHEKVGKSWVNSAFKDMRVRRGEILAKTQEAKKLEVDMETEENVDDEYIEKACGVKATIVRRGQIELRTNFSVEKSQRMMREFHRANALGYWIRRGGELKLPSVSNRPGQGRFVVICIDSRDQYKKYAAAVAAEGKMHDDDAKLLERPNTDLASFNFKGDGAPRVLLAQWEATATCALMVWTANMADKIRTPLSVGHLNWLALTCLGTTLPNYVIKEGAGKGYGDTKVAGEDREREELMRLAKSGIAGSRTWMQFLAERGEDPSFGNSLVESFGEIQGNDLHKCTSIVEFMMEAGTFYDPIYKKLSTKAEGSPVSLYTAAMGMPFGELETKWREWLLGSRPGVAERIDKENLNAWPKDALLVLAYMNEIRENSFKGKIEGVWKLKFDADLSEPCALHAHYLTLNPDQKKWPDAHEEYADREGYTVEGTWAGLHSVIAWGGIEDYKESIDLWMGSFYHRLPLIDPGVLRLGWGQEDIWWVMDMSSLAAPYDKPYTVVYPYDGQKDVPTAFVGNEFPDPVPEPGVDVNEAEVLGYPITIQTNPVDEKGEIVDIRMKLMEGDKEVECHFSSPTKPSNPESAPAGAWCLLPKKALKPKTEYRVVADWMNSNKKTTSTAKHMEWTFKTQ
jgi:phosphotransferase system IIB component